MSKPKPSFRLATLEDIAALQQASFPELGPHLVPARHRVTANTVPPKRPPSGGRVPYDVALRQITKTVIVELSAIGEQWSDAARQDLISTLFIAACKDKKIAFDFDREAA